MSARSRRFLFLIAIVLAGCDSKPPQSHLPEAKSDTVPLFKAGKGIMFSEETIALFGLKIAEVTERSMRRQIEKTARVYRAANGTNAGGALVFFGADESTALAQGQAVSLRAVTGSAAEITGRLVRLDPPPHTAFGQVEALIEFDDPQRTLPTGAFVTSTFVSSVAKSLLAIPASALLVAADGNYVYTVNGSHLTRTRVTPGASSEGAVAIEDGLYAGDSVAVQGVENLWLVELSALKGGTPCCAAPKKDSAK